MSSLDTPLDTVVVGAGQAGLALGHYLQRAGRRFVVLEAAERVGDSWRRRWDSLTLFTPRRYDALPGMRFPGDPEGYPGKDEVADYLDAYASQFDLPVRLGRRVTSVRRDGAGRFRRRHERRRPSRPGRSSWPRGAFTGPAIPGFAGRLGSDVVQLHSSAYRNPASVPEGEVVVVGAGNTGVQIAAELADAGRRVSLAVSTRAGPPRAAAWAGACSGGSSGWADGRGPGLPARPPPEEERRTRSSGTDLKALFRNVNGSPRLWTPTSGGLLADGRRRRPDAVVWATGYRPRTRGCTCRCSTRPARRSTTTGSPTCPGWPSSACRGSATGARRCSDGSAATPPCSPIGWRISSPPDPLLTSDCNAPLRSVPGRGTEPWLSNAADQEHGHLAWGRMDGVTFGVLGPVEVRVPDRPPVALPPAVRALLARLAMSPGRVVSVDALTDALWGEDLPGDAGNALQIRVSKLRRALAAAGAPGDLLLTRAPGYRLAVDADAVDAQRFERLLATPGGRPAPTRAAALALLDEALALWRGQALADVGDAEWIEAESTRLEELRLGALEDRLELLLELGRHGEAVADLERLATLHPLRERLHRLLLTALYRAGRQAEAVTLYHRLRGRLADELGIDPSPELQALAEAILRQQVPVPRAGRADHEAHRPGEALPRHPGLPRRLSEVIGRRDDIDGVLEQLRSARLVTLTGPGGVGKTTLAGEVARAVADGAGPGVTGDVRLVRLAALEPGADVAQAVARQLGLQPPGPGPAAVAAVVAFLAPLDTLLVVDNCEHVVDSAAEVVEQVLQACPRVRVLTTSREALAVAGEVQVAVHPLAQEPAVRLFVERARAVRPGFTLDGDNAPLAALICRQLDGVPLAIELAAARTKRCRCRRSPTGSETASRSSRPARGRARRGTAPCGRRSTGATSC